MTRVMALQRLFDSSESPSVASPRGVAEESLTPTTTSGSSSSDVHVPPSSAAPSFQPPACSAGPTQGSATSGPCNSASGAGFIVGGLLCIVAGIIVTISILVHFYRRAARRGGRVANDHDHIAGLSAAAAPGAAAPGGRGATDPPPISVQAVDDEGSRKGPQLSPSRFTEAVCVRVPGAGWDTAGLLIAWPEHAGAGPAAGAGAGAGAAAGEKEAGESPVDPAREASIAGSLGDTPSQRFWLQDLWLGWRLGTAQGEKDEGLHTSPSHPVGASPDSTEHSSLEYAGATGLVVTTASGSMSCQHEVYESSSK